MRQGALVALLASALPLSLIAQIRRPDPVSSAGPRRGRASVPARRSEFFVGLGTASFDKANATAGSVPMLSLGFRQQFSPQWLHVAGAVDLGTTKVDGQFFPYEKRPTGDSLQFVAVDGNATMVAGRVSVDALFAVDDDSKYRLGGSLNVGVYAMMPRPAGGANAGTFVAPTYGLALVGHGDITKRLGVAGSLGLAQFLNFDRDKLRPSDSTLEDPAFVTPFFPPVDGVKSFGGVRLVLGLTYRLGVKSAPARTAR